MAGYRGSYKQILALDGRDLATKADDILSGTVPEVTKAMAKRVSPPTVAVVQEKPTKQVKAAKTTPTTDLSLATSQKPAAKRVAPGSGLKSVVTEAVDTMLDAGALAKGGTKLVSSGLRLLEGVVSTNISEVLRGTAQVTIMDCLNFVKECAYYSIIVRHLPKSLADVRQYLREKAKEYIVTPLIKLVGSIVATDGVKKSIGQRVAQGWFGNGKKKSEGYWDRIKSTVGSVVASIGYSAGISTVGTLSSYGVGFVGSLGALVVSSFVVGFSPLLAGAILGVYYLGDFIAVRETYSVVSGTLAEEAAKIDLANLAQFYINDELIKNGIIVKSDSGKLIFTPTGEEVSQEILAKEIKKIGTQLDDQQVTDIAKKLVEQYKLWQAHPELNKVPSMSKSVQEEPQKAKGEQDIGVSEPEEHLEEGLGSSETKKDVRTSRKS